MFIGWSLVKGKSPVDEGDTITIVRDKVVGAGSNSNRIVRFARNGREVGRLPRDVASYISILLDQNICQFEGNIVWCPSTLKIGEDMILMVKCYITLAGMHSASFISEGMQQVKRKDKSTQHEIPVQRKMALIQMFRNLGMKPVRSAIQKMGVADGSGNNDNWDTLLQSVAAADVNEGDKEYSSQQQEVEGDDGEEKKAITDDQLDTIYEKAQMFDSQIKPLDTPITMALELKEYQKRVCMYISAFDKSEVN